MAARAVAAGHELGNHMWPDQWSFMLTQAAFQRQLDDTTAASKGDLAAAGLIAPLRWFRPSGGWPHPPMLEWAGCRGFQTVLGPIWPLDGLGIAPPEQAQRWFVEQFAHPAPRRTLLEEVPDLQLKGFSFVTLSTLLGQG